MKTPMAPSSRIPDTNTSIGLSDPFASLAIALSQTFPA